MWWEIVFGNFGKHRSSTGAQNIAHVNLLTVSAMTVAISVPTVQLPRAWCSVPALVWCGIIFHDHILQNV